MTIVRTAEIFAGAGLFGGAFKDVGFRTVYAAEINAMAVNAFSRNVAAVAEIRDVRLVRTDVRCDLLLAGPPCQGFSTQGACNPDVHAATGKRRNKLSLTVAKWAQSTGARVVVVENVPNFLDSWYWARLRRAMEQLGYECGEWVLKAEHYGTPQLRTRAFGVFSKIGLPASPKATVLEPMTVHEAFDGLPVEPKHWMRPKVGGAIQIRTGDDMHVAPTPSPIALERFKRLPPCGGRRDIARRAPHLCPPSWRRLGVEATDVWGRLNYDRPSNTLRCDFQNASKGRYVHPVADRVITLREGARIQGVPDNWQFEGARLHIAQQIGNGVPLPLGRAVARALKPLFS